MGKSKKVRIDTGRLVRSYPKLMNLGRGEARSKIVRMIKKSKQDTLKSACECVSAGLNTLKPGNFTKEELKLLNGEKEMLRFIAQAATCNASKKRRLSKKVQNAMVQSGGGIGLILSVLLQALISLITKKLS